MEAYTVSSRSYLARAQQRLESGASHDLFYAALELRCGVEARLQEYLEPHEFIPLGKRTDWRVGNLHRTMDKHFRLGDQVARVRIVAQERLLATLYYVPVSNRLKEIAHRLGDYLHAGKKHHAVHDPYWPAFRALLEEGEDLLRQATSGTLLGPMTIDSRTGQSLMPVELLPDANGVIDDALRNLRGRSVTLDVSYHPNLAAASADAA